MGGEGVQQAFLRLLEGTTVTLQAKPPPVSASSKKEVRDDLSGDAWTSDAGLRGGYSALGPKKGVRDGLPGFGSSASKQVREDRAEIQVVKQKPLSSTRPTSFSSVQERLSVWRIWSILGSARG